MGQARRNRTLGCVVAVAVVLAGCGGSDDGGAAAGSEATEGADTNGTDSGGANSGGTDSGEGAEDWSGTEIAFDASGLSTERLAPISGSAPAVAAVVDTCAALSAEDVAATHEAVEDEYSFGGSHSYTASADGASCIYTGDDVHVIALTIGSTAEVFPDSSSAGLPLPVAAGELTAVPWTSDPAVSILSEDSFGIDTVFAAHVAAGDLGLIVGNLGGTGVDSSREGELFARLVTTAAERVDSLPRVDSEPNAPTTSPCEVWTVAELDAFLPDTSVTSDSEVTMTDGCVWTTAEFDHEVLLAIVGEDELSSSDYAPVSDDSSVLRSTYGQVLVRGADGSHYRVDVRYYDAAVDGAAATLALAENLAGRVA